MRLWRFQATLLLSVSLLGGSLAGTLGSFEEAVSRPKPAKDKNPPSAAGGRARHPERHHSSNGGFLNYCFGWMFWRSGPDESVLIVDSDEMETASTADVLAHRPGSPGLPYLRLDYRWQYLEHDLGASDFLLETGYEFAAFYGRVTHYSDRASAESLDIEQYYGMLRFGGSDNFNFPGSVELGIGAGAYSIKGESEQDGVALTVPVLFYPNEWFGVEFRPAWALINEKAIGDYDLSVSLGRDYTHLQLGYRWLWIEQEGCWLNGPYAGLFVSF